MDKGICSFTYNSTVFLYSCSNDERYRTGPKESSLMWDGQRGGSGMRGSITVHQMQH